MKYLRVYADDEGNSHFEDGEFETNPVDLVEGFPPASFTGAIPVSEVQMFRLEPGDWIDDWHPAPRRQIAIILSGGIEMESSDGKVRRLLAGDILLAEDTHGEGHRNRSIDGQKLVVAWMPLVEDRGESS
ncbi:MAG: hypothetical protein R3A46_11070 [Thermomicrobiales bacterium]